MKLSILIVNWNSKDYLRECLHSIRRTCSHQAPQVVVVDGGSFDGCAEMLDADFPEVVFVQSPNNIGFGRSNNLGLDSVTGEALLLLNPDTELHPGAVDALLDELERLPDAGLFGARLLNSDGSIQFSAVHPLPTPLNVAMDSDWFRRRWWNRKEHRDANEAFQVEAVSGACMMMRAETFRKLGGFDPRYFMYAEDMDLCFRIRKSGLRIYHAPQAKVVHHGGGSSSNHFSKFAEVMIRQALDCYFLANHGRLHSFCFRSLILLSAVFRMTILWLRGLFVRGRERDPDWSSISKWWALMRWSIGLEGWAANWFSFGGNSATLGKAG